MNDLVERCKAHPGIAGWLLKNGHLYEMPKEEPARMRLEHVTETDPNSLSAKPEDAFTDPENIIEDLEDVPTFHLQSLKLDPSLNTPVRVEDATVKAIFSLPRTMKLTGRRLMADVLQLRQSCFLATFTGPYLLALSRPLFCDLEPFDINTLRRVEGVSEVVDCVLPETERLERKTKAIAMIQHTPDVIRMIVGNGFVQPQVRSDFYGAHGIALAY